jgi:hypothetical protein
VDVRVDVKIPGGVNAYVIDLRGERCVLLFLFPFPHSMRRSGRHQATPDIWQETYLSAILRAILYSDDPTYFLEAYRRLEPISAPDAELRFLQASEALFMKGAAHKTHRLGVKLTIGCVGWQVGSDPEIQVATVVSNHLTAGIFKYFGDSGRWQHAANLFEKLAAREPEVSSLLARSYIGMSESCRGLVTENVHLTLFRRGGQGGTDNGLRDEADSTVISLTSHAM